MSSTNVQGTRNAELKPLFDSAMEARNSGDFHGAIALLEEGLRLLRQEDGKLTTIVQTQIGNIKTKLGDPAAAELHFAAAVEATPDNELASLGLFHSRAEQAKWELGLCEAVRFLRLKDSTEYRDLLLQGFGADLPKPAQALVEEARELLARH